SASPKQPVQLATFSEPTPTLAETPPTAAPAGPASADFAKSTPPQAVEVVPAPNAAAHFPSGGRPLTLAALEAHALANHPTLAQAAARGGAARADAFQAGLWRNPVAGYLGSEIGNEGRAGQQGFFVSQEFVTGGKLQLSRQTALQVAQRREFELAAQRFRVLNDVRIQFYEV